MLYDPMIDEREGCRLPGGFQNSASEATSPQMQVETPLEPLRRSCVVLLWPRTAMLKRLLYQIHQSIQSGPFSFRTGYRRRQVIYSLRCQMNFGE